MTMGELKVWKNSTIDWYVAESPEHAMALQADTIGSDYPDDLNPLHDWEEETRPTLTIQEYHGEPGDTTHTLAEWIAINGPGMLCSTEF